LRLLCGEDLDTVSREVRVTAATLSQWRDEFLSAGQAGLKSKPTTAADNEVLRLEAMLGEQLMRNELPREAQFRPTGEGESPLPRRVEKMSRTVSPSTGRRYGIRRVAAAWRLSRAKIYRQRVRVR
jgi:transposase-like protein